MRNTLCASSSPAFPLSMPYNQPSTLFTQALFDTEHDRDPSLAPPHGYIQVAHIFVSFEQ